MQPSAAQPPGMAGGALGMMNVRMGSNQEGAMGCQKLMNKQNDKLKLFSGSPLDFDTWAKGFIHHMSKVQIHWRYLLGWLSTHDGDLTLDHLMTMSIGPHNEPAEDLSVKLESTLVDYLPIGLVNRRVQLSGGPDQECNGFAMWRRLHREFKGSGEAVEYAGTEALKEYRRCDRVADLSAHMDAWLSMLNRYGAELQYSPRMVRSMFLDIIPKELKAEINKKKRLKGADHLELMEFCRNKCELILTDNLVEVEKKNLSREFNLKHGGRVNAIGNTGQDDDDQKSGKSELQQMQKSIESLTAALVDHVSAVKPAPPPRKGAGAERGRGRHAQRRDRPQRSPGNSPGRSGSPSRFFVQGWGKRCNHCGSEKHQKKECKEFDEMMRKANVGVAKDKWKPPADYKSALGKARDEARKKSPGRAASPGRVAGLISDGEDTASDSEASDNDSVHPNYCHAMRPVKKGTSLKKARINAIDYEKKTDKNFETNRLQAFGDGTGIDSETVDCLNSWAEKVNMGKPESQSARKKRSKPISSVKDLEKLVGPMASLTLDNKSLAKWVKAVLKEMRIECDNDEILAMIDSGSFTHAADAEVHLPGHEILPPGPRERRRKAETACGGILDIKGLVNISAEVNGNALDIQFCHMKVNTPIISVRRLVKDGYEILICDGGGFIRHMETGKLLYFLEHQGVYYMKLKVQESGFGRLGM